MGQEVLSPIYVDKFEFFFMTLMTIIIIKKDYPLFGLCKNQS